MKKLVITTTTFGKYDERPLCLLKKHGFNVPIDHYLKNQWSDMLKETFSENSFLFKKNLIDKKSILYMDKLLKSNNRLSGHTLLSFIAINDWLKNLECK